MGGGGASRFAQYIQEYAWGKTNHACRKRLTTKLEFLTENQQPLIFNKVRDIVVAQNILLVKVYYFKKNRMIRIMQ